MSENMIKTLVEYNEALEKNDKDHFLIFLYFDEENNECKISNLVFEELSKRHPEVISYIKIDFKNSEEINKHYKIEEVPSIQVYKDKEYVSDRFDQNLLLAINKKESAPSDLAKSLNLNNQDEINHFISKTHLECLNISGPKSVEDLFLSSNEAIFESDADEQIMINLRFDQVVKLHSIKIIAPEDSAPHKIKLFVNQGPLDFDDAESRPITQELTLTKDDYGTSSVTELLYVRFQNVNSLSLFIEDNLASSEVTKVQRIHLFGTPLHTTKMDDFNKKED